MSVDSSADDSYTQTLSDSCVCTCIFDVLRVIISIVVIRYVNDVKGCDRRGAELSNAPLYMKKDTNSITV